MFTFPHVAFLNIDESAQLEVPFFVLAVEAQQWIHAAKPLAPPSTTP